ncbi:MAG: hypothetical protein ACRBB6_03870 [Neptuniibacter sp.]
MEKGNNCLLCADKLLKQNRELWSEAAKRLSDSNNPDWCQICDQLFMNHDAPLRFYHELVLETTTT